MTERQVKALGFLHRVSERLYERAWTGAAGPEGPAHGHPLAYGLDWPTLCATQPDTAKAIGLVRSVAERVRKER